jgi:hypothetical protein
MGDLSCFVSGVVDVVDVFRLIEFSSPKSHPFHEVRMYEIVGGSGIYQCSYIGHVVTCSN